MIAAEPVIPDTHLDLLTRPVHGVFTTIDASGRPQSSLVWVDYDGQCPVVNTTLEREKGRNLVRNPKACLLVVDPDNSSRFLQVRGDIELMGEGAVEHLDTLTRKYTRHPRFYGFVYPEDQQEQETRVICRIHPIRVVLDAIHA